MDYFFVTILGLVIGSFLNVCICRIPKEESISFPPSHCCNCNSRLKALDLIPVVSYIFLKGRCRYCKSKISIMYPLIESLNGILYLIIYYKFNISLITLEYFILVSTLIVISVIDLKTQDIYTSTTIFGSAAGIIFIIIQFFFDKNISLDRILGGILGALIIGAIVFLTKGMGEGDIEIAAICGLFLGVKLVLLTLFLSIIIGGVIGVIILLLKLKGAKERMAFGPCISAGALIALLYGNQIISKYLSLLNL